MKPSISMPKIITDAVSILTSRQRMRQFLSVPLYRNALYLITANAINGLIGIVFWIVVARFYTADDVGLASAAIAAAMLLSSFAHLGLGLGLIRFLPGAGEGSRPMINTSFTIGTLSSLLVATIFIAGLRFWSPALLFIRQDPLYLAAFIVFTVASTLSLLVEHTFIARRRAGFIVVKSAVFNLLRLILPILLAAFFHSFGIFASWGASTGIALMVSLFLFLPRAQPSYYPGLAIRKEAVNDMLHFSFANYISSLLWSAPPYLLPVMVVNLLGAESSAYFYIAWTIAGLVFTVPILASSSFFAEGSHDKERLAFDTWRSLKLVFLILVPIVIVVLVFADKILLLFGGAYSASAATLLRLLTPSAFFVAINFTYMAIKRVEMRLGTIIGLTGFLAVVFLGLSYILLPRIGINGAAVAWLTGQGMAALVIGANSLWRRRT